MPRKKYDPVLGFRAPVPMVKAIDAAIKHEKTRGLSLKRSGMVRMLVAEALAAREVK